MKRPLATLMFVLASASAQAASPNQAAPRGEPPLPPDQPGYCDAHADECAQMRQRHEKFCKRNPHTCAAGEKRREARREYCKQHPDECQAVRDEARSRRDAVRERCEKDPKACQERREEMQQRRDQRRQERQQWCKDHPDRCPGAGAPESEHEQEQEEPERSGPPR